jgi:hypothetical protein
MMSRLQACSEPRLRQPGETAVLLGAPAGTIVAPSVVFNANPKDFSGAFRLCKPVAPLATLPANWPTHARLFSNRRTASVSSA